MGWIGIKGARHGSLMSSMITVLDIFIWLPIIIKRTNDPRSIAEINIYRRETSFIFC